VKIYVAALKALRKNLKIKDRMKLSLAPKLVKILIWILFFFSFGKIFIPSYAFMPYYAVTGCPLIVGLYG
jgi:hypothetical protein